MKENFWLAFLASGEETGLNTVEYQAVCATPSHAEMVLYYRYGIHPSQFQELGDGTRYAAVRDSDSGEWLHFVAAPATRLAV